MLLAVNGADAIPEALVATTMVVVLLLKSPEDPAAGAVNVTFTPGTGLLPMSRTVTASGLAKAVLMVALCGVVPALAVIDAGAPTVLVRLNVAGVTTPTTLAVTL